jgi:hypothetical protein
LLNVLIAVVVDTYGAVKNEDSEEVFWTSRLEFVTEVVVLKRVLKRIITALLKYITTNADEQSAANNAGPPDQNVDVQPTMKTDGQPFTYTGGQPTANTDRQPTANANTDEQPNANSRGPPTVNSDANADERPTTNTSEQPSENTDGQPTVSAPGSGVPPTVSVPGSGVPPVTVKIEAQYFPFSYAWESVTEVFEDQHS